MKAVRIRNVTGRHREQTDWRDDDGTPRASTAILAITLVMGAIAVCAMLLFRVVVEGG